MFAAAGLGSRFRCGVRFDAPRPEHDTARALFVGFIAICNERRQRPDGASVGIQQHYEDGV